MHRRTKRLSGAQFTAFWVAATVACLAAWGGALYVVAHFVMKYW